MIFLKYFENIGYQEEKDNKEYFLMIFNELIRQIYKNRDNYGKIIDDVYVPRNNVVEINIKSIETSKYDSLFFQIRYHSIEGKFEVDIYDKNDKKIFSYIIRNNYYVMEVCMDVYKWHKNKQKSYHYKSKYDKSNKKTSGNYRKKTSKNEKVSNKNNKNRLRRYELLKSTLEGYKRQIDEIRRWETSNGKTHSDRVSVENEIDAVERRINQMKKDYSYERLNYDFIELNLIEIDNRIKNIKNDLGMK